MDRLSEMKLLLVDDDDTIRASMKYFFKNKTFSFLAVETAELGLESLEDGGRWDIIISDYQLPVMNGIDFLEIVRREHPHIMTTLITAYGSEDLAVKAIKVGIHDFIQKPFTTQTIVELIHHLIQKRKQNIYEPSVNGRRLTETEEKEL